MTARSNDDAMSERAPIRFAPRGGHGCAVPDVAPRQRPLAERVDLAELARWNDANAAARLAYRLKPFANRRGVGER